ncbi:MAG: Imm53 family immunity protein [Hyphomonadaceae bacterium]
MADQLSKLNDLFEAQWIEDVGEDVGITIDSLDNPGWSLKVELAWLADKRLLSKHFESVQIERSDRDWLFANKIGTFFEAFGGIRNLDEVIGLFLDWAK